MISGKNWGLWLATICMLPVIAFAQKDKVLLTNGSLIYGKIEALDNKSVLIKVTDENSLTFALTDISRVKIRHLKRRVENLNPEIVANINKAPSFSSGLQKEINVGFLAGADNYYDNSQATPSMSIAGIYQLKRLIQFGLGAAYDQYNDYTSLPLFIHYKAAFSGSWSSPFVYGSVGHGFAWDRGSSNFEIQKVNGGLHLRAGLGYQWYEESLGLEISMGWKHQKVNSEYNYTNFFLVESENTITLLRNMNRLEFKFGIIF